MNRKLIIVLGCCFLMVWKAKAQAPVTDFTATPTSGCAPLAVQFKDLSTNSPNGWTWDFGNGSISNQQNPSFTYGAAGTYTITLISHNASGSNAIRKTAYITVYPAPNIGFSSNLNVACTPAVIQFTDHSTPGQGTLASWNWTFGDGTTSTVQNPVHTYSQQGYYTVSFTVTNSNGCSNSTSIARDIRIVDGIQPNFTFSQTSNSCTGPFVVNFLNQTAGPGNLSYNWTFANGANPAGSTATNPGGVVYPASGQYTVGLQVQSSLGCSQSIQKTINFDRYTASFKGPATVCINTPATFTNTSTPTPSSQIWSFGSGITSSANPSTKSYSAPGTDTVKLVNRYAGCVDSTSSTITVINPPSPDFTANDTVSCQPNFTVQFTDRTPGTNTQWLWDFGDGQTSTQQNPSHTYTTSGSFNVKLTVGNATNCSTSKTKKQYITIQPPTVTINNANTLGACTAGSVGGSANSVSPTVKTTGVTPITGYSWTAPGSNEGSSTSATPTFTYNATGNYAITVTVATADGCTSAPATSTVMIGTPLTGPEKPSFTITDASHNPITSVCGRDVINLTASPADPAYTYVWDFGDGNTSPAQGTNTITYSYSKPWTSPPASITLTIKNKGCPSIASNPLVVNPPFPNFGYKVTCHPTDAPVAFNSTDSSYVNVNDPNSYVWDFGGIGNAFQPNPSFVFPSLTPYDITLTITDGGCTQSYKKTLLLAKPSPSFTGNPSSICKHVGFTLNSTTSFSPPAVTADQYIKSYIWTFGSLPPDTTTADSVTAGFSANGTYNTTLTTVDIYGCKTTGPAVPITAIGPTAHFTSPPSVGGCKNGAITFTENSSHDPAATTIVNWTWNFGDNTTSTSGPTVTHTYADTGYYPLSLSVVDNGGCHDSYTVSDSFHITSPLASFGLPDSFYCPGRPLNFLDSSQGFGLSHTWNYGDNSPTDHLGSHTYSTPGQTYPVTLTITDTNSCTSPLTKSISIQSPVAAFDIADTTAICTPLQTKFTSHSRYYDSLYWAFGDGTTSTLPVTSHFYNTLDTFVAKLYVRGPGGCLDSASRRVLVLDPAAIAKISYSPVSKCDSLLVNFSLVVPGYTSFSVIFGDGNTDSSGNTRLSHLYKNPNTFTPVMLMQDATGCIVGANGGSQISILGATPFFNVNQHSFCDSGLVAFTDYTISNNGYKQETYTFSDGSPSQTASPGNGAFNVSNYFSKPGTWPVTLTVNTDSGCTESYKDTIRVYQTPHPAIAVTSLPCAGFIQFHGSINAPQVDTIDWAWNFGNGQTSAIQDPNIRMAAGNYRVTLKTTTFIGCSDTTSSQLTVHANPVITGPRQITTPLGIPVTIPFTYSGGITNYSWSPAVNLDCPTCPNPVATLLLSTQYEVQVTDSIGCKSTDSIFIKTICNTDNIFMPNTFSPNGDGVNDVFYPRGKSLFNVQSLSVFNRWGQMVFQRRDFPANMQSMGWDGTFNGKPAPSDAYVYVVEVICENAQLIAIHGSVTLVR